MTYAARLAIRLLPGIALLALWQVASGRWVRPIYISRPTDVAARLVEMFATNEIQPHLWTTFQELVLGYLFGVSAGIVCGYVLGRSPRAAAIFEPYLMAFYGIPKIALAPCSSSGSASPSGARSRSPGPWCSSWSSTASMPASAPSTRTWSTSPASWAPPAPS